MRMNEEKLAVMRARLHKPAPDSNAQLEKAKSIATIVSAIAIPIVLMISGYFIQRQLADEGLKKDYVAIAAGILKENPTTQEPELRQWAVNVLEGNSPIPFSSKAKAGLLVGQVVGVPPPAWPTPPKGCMAKPGKRTLLDDYTKLVGESKSASREEFAPRLIAFIEKAVDQELAVGENRARLECLQSWIDMTEEMDTQYRNSIGAPSSKSVFEKLRKERDASAAKPPTGKSNGAAETKRLPSP